MFTRNGKLKQSVMNVLESIKTLQHDLATGFKSLTMGGAGGKSNVDTPSSEEGSSGQLEAGAALLNRFQTQWTKLHQDAEENATIAEGVDQQVTGLYLRLERENHAVTQLVAELTSIPQLLYNIQQSMDMIGEIEVHCSELDVAFDDLRDVCRECELRNNKQRHEYQLSLYQQRRELELEQNKVQLAMKHARTVERYEAKLQATLREKQQACEAASKQELEHYRLHGHAQLKPSPPTESQVELADISLEQDKTELDAFLRSDTDTGENDTPSAELTRPTTSDVTENGGAQLNADVTLDDTGQHNEVKDIEGPNSEPDIEEDQHLNDSVTTE